MFARSGYAWKACVGETLLRVRIPLYPPVFAHPTLRKPDQCWIHERSQHQLWDDLRERIDETGRIRAVIHQPEVGASGSGNDSDTVLKEASTAERQTNRDDVTCCVIPTDGVGCTEHAE